MDSSPLSPDTPDPPVAIVGAGPAGLAAAYLLESLGLACRVFEKSRGVAGRAASRSREECRYDHGANYFTRPDGEAAALLFDGPLREGLVEFAGDILPFDCGDGGRARLLAHDPQRSPTAKWTYPTGINTLGKRLIDSGGIAVTFGTRIARLRRNGSGAWALQDEADREHGPFRAVLVTSPTPQAAELIAASSFDPTAQASLRKALGRVGYASQFSIVASFSGSLALPREAYALINSDRRHEIAWVGHENRKPGRVPPGESLFVVQMSPEWTAGHWDAAPQDAALAAVSALRRLLGPAWDEATAPLRWTDTQRWRYALPMNAVPAETLGLGERLGLHFAGDGLVGKGRVAGALDSGLAAARRIAGSMPSEQFGRRARQGLR